ncbi:uncharacterized protein N7483_007908 [Penicillium malachiteum]|uniref:uncharacterized protein n=1 Tax=Penicillium malachiteum TaxID=1324776 RepID=UPI002547EB20|nr:uncharacterized protein N7483_007908 [Penicillium malachiteum]KAJ5726551.1 hypothetical protein N7483_007908 [Penicillium malachiteum]
MTNIKVQIISDSVCPWCYIGYRRLTRAIKTHLHSNPTDTFTLHWRAFYLNPNAAPYPGVNKSEMYHAKFGVERCKAMFARLQDAGHAEGVEFSFDGNTGSTRDSHRLIWFAGQEKTSTETASAEENEDGKSVQTRVVENLFKAYFEESKNITDKEVLIEAGVLAGLDRGDVTKVLDDGTGAEEVDAEALTASRRLVSGVPNFTIQGKYLIEGADEPETFLEVFERVKLDE